MFVEKKGVSILPPVDVVKWPPNTLTIRLLPSPIWGPEFHSLPTLCTNFLILANMSGEMVGQNFIEHLQNVSQPSKILFSR